MQITNYPIFKKAKYRKIYLEFYALFIILLSTIAFVWAKNSAGVSDCLFWILAVLFILSFIPLILIVILNHYKIDFKRGKFQGNMSLQLNQISINDKIVSLNQIKNIQITNHDFFIRYDRNKILGPKISSGTANVCKIELIDGGIIEFNFYQAHDNELVKAEFILRYYQSKGKLSLENLNNILFGYNKTS